MAQHSTVPHLPEELLLQVLRRLDLRQRLGSCSLVCKLWQAGAVAATSTVSLTLSDNHTYNEYGYKVGSRSPRADSLVQWLVAHGAAVTHVDVHSVASMSVPLQLPYTTLTQLQQLQISNCLLQERPRCNSSRNTADTALWQQQHLAAHHSSSWASSSSGKASLACLTSLTGLTLNNIMCGLSDGVAGLSALTGLQQLLLGRLQLPPITLQRQNAAAQLHYEQFQQRHQQLCHGAVEGLCRLSRLTQLELQHCQLLGEASGPFWHMQQLLELKLLQAPVTCVDVLQGLPSSLTKLEVTCSGEIQLSSSTVPALSRLTALQHLILHAEADVELDPSFVGCMQQLRVVSLQGRLVGDTQQPGDLTAAAAASLRGFLDALSRLSQLGSLAVTNTSYDDLQPLPASDVAKYSALLSASTHLTHLQLCWNKGCLLPSDCWEHVFAAGWQLPQLKQLWIGLPESLWRGGNAADEVASRVETMKQFLSCDDLSRLVHCCPALELLSMPGILQPMQGLGPLTALTALTGLCLGGSAVDDEIAKDLAGLTGLEQLRIYSSPEFADQGLLALSALRKLTQLEVWHCDISQALSDEAYNKVVHLESKGAELPDVWLQVIARCARSIDCESEAIDELVTLTTAQQLETIGQYKVLTESLQLQHEANQKAAQIMVMQQDLLESRQAQLVTATAAVADMTQQLSASRAELLKADLHARSLERQLVLQSMELAAAREQLAVATALQGS